MAVAASLVLAACSGSTDPEPERTELTEPTGRIVATSGNAIVTMDIDGGNRRQYNGLASVAQYGLHPSWSADRSRIFVHTVTSGNPGTVRIHAVDVASGTPTPLAATTTAFAHEWYPRTTGEWVYFMGETAAGEFRAWRIRQDGTEARALPGTTPDYGNYYRPTVSSDGGRLAVSTVVQGSIGVRVFNAQSGAALSPWIAGATAPRWSPDGREVAMSTPRGGVIRIMGADGTGLRALSSAHYDEWFDWTADGGWLVVTDDEGLKLVRIADGETRLIPNTQGMWQPAITR